MRRRVSLLIISALVGLAVLPVNGAAAAGGGVNDNPTLRCLVNLQLGADRDADVSTEVAATITELSDNLGCGKLRTLEGVEALSSLEVLKIHDPDHTTLNDLTPLSQLPLLEELDLSSAPGVTDLTPLGGLMNMKHLSLTGVRVHDASVLAQLPSLRSLTFQSAWDLDITSLAGLDQVRSLTFKYMPSPPVAEAAIDLTGVGDMASLTELDVHYSSLTDLAPLATATQLETLTLSRNTISDVSPLKSLTSLTALRLAENDIADISPLQDLTQLTELDLSWNDVSNLAPLAGMTALTRLKLDMNKITDVAPLGGLRSVEELGLWNNTVRDVHPLAGMTGIRTANLAYNQIDDVSALSRWTNADNIFLSDNAITDLRPLRDLKADVGAGDQLARVPDGTTINKVAPVYNKKSRLCPLKVNERGNAVWSCGDGKFYGQVRTTSGNVPGPAPTPSPTTPSPSSAATPKPTPQTPPATVPPPFPKLPFSVYTTPGEHTVNGRQWKTACEPYSQTWRCRTDIWGTKVTLENGRFLARNGWSFNNLTYLPSPRSMWTGNPLAKTGSWTASDGRKWRTECDTSVTGRNGCRTWVSSRVIMNLAKPGAPARYGWETVEVFNNMVLFG